jgi:hypothetical protein
MLTFSNFFLATLVIHFWQVADANGKSGEQVQSKNHMTCEYSGKPNQFSQEVEGIWCTLSNFILMNSLISLP